MIFPGNLKIEPIALAPQNTVSMPWLLFFQEAAKKIQQTVITFHDARPKHSARDYVEGTLLYETDRNAWFINIEARWVWFGGEMAGTLDPDTKPGDLLSDDAGFLFRATDFDHLYRWTGIQWVWANPSDCSGKIEAFAFAPPSSGWHLCDGTSVTYAMEDGNIDTMALPNLTSGAYLKGGVYDGTVNSAVAPTLSGNTDPASSGTPTGTVTSTFTGTPQNFSSAVIQSGSGAGALTGPNVITPAGSVASTFTGNTLGTHSHGTSAITVSATAEPKNLKVGWYFRR